MKLTTMALAIIAIAAFPMSALADSIEVRPDGAGGFVVDPHDINQGTTTVRSDGAGGYEVNSVGHGTVIVRPDGAGGYTIDSRAGQPIPSWLPSILPPQP